MKKFRDKDQEEFIALAKKRAEEGRLIEACIFLAESGNDRRNWKAKPKPPLGKLKTMQADSA